jgi:hypothetical protein
MAFTYFKPALMDKYAVIDWVVFCLNQSSLNRVFLLQILGNQMDTLDHVPDMGTCCVSSAERVHMPLQSPTCSTSFPSTRLECQRKLKATLLLLTTLKPMLKPVQRPDPKPDILPLLLIDQGWTTPHAQFLAIESPTHEPPYRISEMYLRRMCEAECIWRFW